MIWLEVKEFLKDALKVIIIIVIALLLLIYVFSITQVVGNSMYPTLQNGNLMILNKLKYRFHDIEREDIISLEYKDTKYLIKRVIGLPGEKIYIKDSKLYINDEIYEENYISNDLVYEDFNITELGYEVIPDNMYLVLGDNRVDSLDGRDFGLISKDQIQGKISFRFWPLNKFKFY